MPESSSGGIYPSYFKEEDVKIHPFDNFKLAIKFLNTSGIEFELIVSNYCTFSWTDNLYGEANEEEICFSFYNNISSSHPKLPFVLFSSYSQRDKRLKDYICKESFFYVDKDASNGLDQIKSILNSSAPKFTQSIHSGVWADFEGVYPVKSSKFNINDETSSHSKIP